MYFCLNIIKTKDKININKGSRLVNPKKPKIKIPKITTITK